MEYKKHNKKWFFMISVIMYIFCGNVISVFSTPVPFRDWALIFFTLAGCFSLVYYILSKPIRMDSQLLLLFLFMLFSVIPTMTLYSEYPITTVVYETFQSLFWIAAFAFAYFISLRDTHIFERSKWLAIIFIPVFSYLFTHVKAFSSNRGIPLISSVYYAVMLLPYLFLIKKMLLRNLLLLCVFAVVLLSVKRTAFIIFLLAIIVYFFADLKVNSINIKKKRNLLLGGIALAVIIYFFFSFFIEKFDISILDRLSSIKDDEGSGRIDIWKHTIDMIKDSDVAGLLFGHGFDGVYINSVIGYSAHTDILEVVYDYGLIGTFLYVSFYFRIIAQYKYLLKEKSDLAAPLACSLALAAGMSLTSHLLIYPTYFIFLCVFWGIIAGKLDRERTERS